jgi:hypothetical protein
MATFFEYSVRGSDHGTAFTALTDDLEQQVGARLIDG